VATILGGLHNQKNENVILKTSNNEPRCSEDVIQSQLAGFRPCSRIQFLFLFQISQNCIF